MAQFRVGQRVRVRDVSRTPGHSVYALVGAEGAIVKFEDYPGCAPICVRVDAALPLNSVGLCQWNFWPDELAPLTDPSADQFIARLKKLGSEPVNDAPKVAVRDGA